MKFFLRLIFALILSTIALQCSVFASNVIDTTNAAKGTVSVTYTGGFTAPVKLRVLKDSGENYQYNVKTNSPVIVPLQMGVGSYTVALFQGVGGNKYKALQQTTFKVDSIDESTMFLSSSAIIDYASSKEAIPYYKGLTADKPVKEKVDIIYKDIVEKYSYDYDKAKNAPNDYVPVIDNMFLTKKGICYDYAAILAGALRSQGIPAKLCMGYAPEITEYHAWCQVFLDGKWVTVDTTYDSQMSKGKAKYTFAKDSSKFKVVKTY